MEQPVEAESPELVELRKIQLVQAQELQVAMHTFYQWREKVRVAADRLTETQEKIDRTVRKLSHGGTNPPNRGESDGVGDERSNGLEGGQ